MASVFCGRGINCAGPCSSGTGDLSVVSPPYAEVWWVLVWVPLYVPFSPSLVGESPLSLLLSKFMDTSMGSMFWSSSLVVNDCSAVDRLALVVVAVAGLAVVVKRAAGICCCWLFRGSPLPSLLSGDPRPPHLTLLRGPLLAFRGVRWYHCCYDR